MKYFVILLVSVGLLYTVIPWVITRIMGAGIFRKGTSLGEVAFTFDDGPNPAYTPRLLDVLQRHGVRATFFVLGEKAEKYPELIRRIHLEGHQIGVHNYSHKSNWIMPPWKVREQAERSAAAIESITGEHPAYYRPPWGMFNLCDLLLQRKYTFVLWSLMARDWRSHVGRSRLKSALLKRVSDGSVVLLHDCGETLGADRDAPEHMLRALEEVLIRLKNRNYRYVRIDEMIRPRPGLILQYKRKMKTQYMNN